MKIDPTINAELNRQVGGLLKDLSGSSLGNCILSPRVNGVANDTMRQLTWNEENLALAFRKLSLQARCPINRGKMLAIFHERVLPLTLEKSGSLSQLTQAFGELKLNSEDIISWTIDNGYRMIPQMNAKELYMFFDGLPDIIPSAGLPPFLLLVEAHPNRNTLLQEMQPQGISCLLKACRKANYKGPLTAALLHLAEKKFQEFQPKYLVDLIGGLNPSIHVEHELASKLLQQIEQFLAHYEKKDLKQTLIFSQFVKADYTPVKLEQKLKDLFESKTTPLWDKISLLQSAVLLGMLNDLQKPILLSLLEETNGQLNKIYPADLIILLETGELILDEKESASLDALRLHLKSK